MVYAAATAADKRRREKIVWRFIISLFRFCITKLAIKNKVDKNYRLIQQKYRQNRSSTRSTAADMPRSDSGFERTNAISTDDDSLTKKRGRIKINIFDTPSLVNR